MKYLSSLMTLLSLVMVVGGMTSCSDDPVDQSTVPSAELVVGTVGTNTAELKFTTNNIQEYAYQVTTNMTATAPTATVLFGTGTKGVPANGTNIINIKDLEGDTEYQIFMATKSANGFGDVLSEKFRTAKYTELLTFVGNDYFSITFHIEVPAGKVIAYSVADRERYIGLKDQMGTIDATYLDGAEPLVTVLKESATVTFEGWWDEDWETGEKELTPILPGQALVLICGEVVAGEPDDYDRPTWKVLFDFDKFWGYEDGGDPGPLSNNTRQGGGVVPEDECWTTEYHKTMLVGCKPADRMKDTHVKVDVVSHTTRTIELTLTPDPALQGFGWAYIDVPLWESMVEMLGEDGALTWFSMNGMGLDTEPVTAAMKDLVPGLTYRMVMCGVGNEERTLQSVDYYDFKAKTATKEAPKMVVKGIQAPEGQVESPWTVWFNVKSPSKDVVTAKYACNGIRDWVAVLNGGMTYSAVVDQQGNPMTRADVNMINSDAGLNMSFPSWEDAETRLAVCGYNDELTMSSPDEDPDGVADMRTIAIPNAPRVESGLFTELVGDWTATVYKFDQKWVDNVMTWVPNETPVITKVTVSAVPTHPATCPEEVYALYEGKTREEVDALFAEFISSSDKYAGKVRGQNRLLCEGLHVGDMYQTPYKSPWDLFINETYSSYSTDDLFYDFGPKWYLEIAEGDQVSVPVDLATMAPMSAWFYDTFYMVGAGDKTFASDLKNFGVTLSADKQTLTVEPHVNGDETFYPALAAIDSYGANISVKCQSIVLTKGWTEQPAANAARRSSLKGVSMSATTPINVVKAHHKTRLNKMAPRGNYKKVTMKPFSMVDHLTNMKNQAKKANR